MCQDVKGKTRRLTMEWILISFFYHACSAGQVIAVHPNVNHIKVGDRVAYLSFGSYSDYIALDASQAAKIPDNVSYKDAAAASIQALTALALVRDAYHVKKGGTHSVETNSNTQRC